MTRDEHPFWIIVLWPHDFLYIIVTLTFPSLVSSRNLTTIQIIWWMLGQVLLTHAHQQSTAGRNWFDLPRTQMTPEFKRDWQLLRMRGVLDPKHQKKALRASAPEFSHVGEIIAGPTEFFSARLTRKERKRTLLEEVMSVHDNSKFETKYAGIQKQKSSGKKAFYNKLVTRRKRRN